MDDTLDITGLHVATYKPINRQWMLAQEITHEDLFVKSSDEANSKYVSPLTRWCRPLG